MDIITVVGMVGGVMQVAIFVTTIFVGFFSDKLHLASVMEKIFHTKRYVIYKKEEAVKTLFGKSTKM